jgi:hypothetical protein
MSFAIFSNNKITEHIKTFATVESLVAVVGAGASVEARLPKWDELVRELLSRSVDLAPGLSLNKKQKKAWIDRTIQADSLLGAAATADALIDGRLDEQLEPALFGDAGPTGFRPGPTLIQLAHLREAFGERLILITTNYDDLLEQALDRRHCFTGRVASQVDPSFSPSTERVDVFHPHGFTGRDGREPPFVLTEEDYQRFEAAADAEATIGNELRRRACLFVGASLNDANLLRYIYRYSRGTQPHAVIFVRQAEYDDVDVETEGAPDLKDDRLANAVRKARHIAIEARWEKRNITTIFVDHFSDVSFFLHEVAYCKRVGVENYQPLAVRTRRWLRRIEQRLFNRRDEDAFRAGQQSLNQALRNALSDARSVVDEQAERDGLTLDWEKERLAMTLWLASPSGTHITDVAGMTP